MTGMRYTRKHLSFLARGYKKMQASDLAIAFNKRFGLNLSASAIRSALRNYGIVSGRKAGSIPGKRLTFDKKQIKFIEREYVRHNPRELAIKFNERFENKKTAAQIRAFIHNHKIQSGRTGHFDKGHRPWNTGTKGKGICKRNSGSFGKGNNPPNRKPLGSERIDNKDGYIHVKITEKNPYTGAPTRYKQKHVVLWEAVNGPAPPGMTIAFKDGNKLNVDIDNLMLVSRAELLRLNQRHYKEMPEELKPSLLALTKMEVKAFGRSKETANKTC